MVKTVQSIREGVNSPVIQRISDPVSRDPIRPELIYRDFVGRSSNPQLDDSHNNQCNRTDGKMRVDVFFRGDKNWC